MTEGLEAVTTASLGLALDAASLRHKAIAANIANHASDGYVPLRLDFAAQLADAQRALRTGGSASPRAAFSRIALEAQPVLDANGLPAKVHLDAEVAHMAENAVHYQALARALSRHFSLLHSAVSDGKR